MREGCCKEKDKNTLLFNLLCRKNLTKINAILSLRVVERNKSLDFVTIRKLVVYEVAYKKMLN